MTAEDTTSNGMEKIISLAKRRGFIYQGSEIYGGLAGTWDYGPMGAALKRNITDLWWKRFVEERSDMYGMDTAIIMPEAVWRASGHLEGFADPMVECVKCKHRFRADTLTDTATCPDCGGALGEPKMFNLLFPVSMGSTAGSGTTGYLRGEIAQGMFVNFKNIIDTFHPDIPFGIAQYGKAFRNEIAPRDFLFRIREFNLMEFEYFIRKSEWERWFEYWREEMWQWMDAIGLSREHIHELEVPDDERAHYSKRTIDFEYDYPFGRKELYGLAYRTDYDLSRHTEASAIDLSYYDQEKNERFIPHVIEPTFGIDRTVLALLSDAYAEEDAPTADGGMETRVVMKFNKKVAPVQAAILPLMRKDDLMNGAKAIFDALKKDFRVQYDETASIGKRYRRQDEIGTPYCITFDYDSLSDEKVTVRDRDTMQQERVLITNLRSYLTDMFAS